MKRLTQKLEVCIDGRTPVVLDRLAEVLGLSGRSAVVRYLVNQAAKHLLNLDELAQSVPRPERPAPRRPAPTQGKVQVGARPTPSAVQPVAQQTVAEERPAPAPQPSVPEVLWWLRQRAQRR